jgi:hypothetical protein
LKPEARCGNLEHTVFKKGKIAVSIGGQMNLRYTVLKENGFYKVDDIENLGLLNDN